MNLSLVIKKVFRSRIQQGLLVLCCLCAVNTYAQSWLWARQPMFTGNPPTQSNGEQNAVATDNSGYVYATGEIAYAQVRYGSYTLTAPNNPTMFLVKYDPAGNVMWAKQATQLTIYDMSMGNSVTIDPFGNVYVTGFFRGTISFGAVSLTAVYSGEVFLVKYDAAGNVLWAKQSNCNSFSGRVSQGRSVITDQAGSVYITGEFHNITNFGAFTLNSPANSDGNAFVVKYDSLGNELWAMQSVILSQTNSGIGKAITLDRFNNIYITGLYRGTISFGGYTLTNTAVVGNIFIVKLDSLGNTIWAKQSRNNSTQYWSNGPVAGNGITTDPAGNVYITGNFEDTIHIDNFTLINPIPFNFSFPYGNALIAKYDPSGNCIWAKAANPLSNATYAGRGVSVDNLNRLFFYFTGFNFNGTKNNYRVIFGTDTFSLPGPASVECSIILEMDTNGNVKCGSIIPVNGDDMAGLGVSPSGQYIYIGGDQYLQYNVTIGNDVLSIGTNPVNQGVEIPFVARWEPCNPIIPLSGPVARNNALCNGSCNGSATVNPAGGTPPYTFAWNTIPVQTTQTITGLCAGAYQVTITDSTGATLTTNFTIGQPSAIQLLTSSDTALCEGQTAGLSVDVVGGNSGFTFKWSPASGLSDTSGADVSASPLVSTTYLVTATSSIGCTGLDSVAVVIHALSLPLLSVADSLICSGDSTSICISNSFTSYQWNTGDTSACVMAKNAGGYIVTVTDANQCTTSGRREISIHPVSSVSVVVQGDTLSSFGAVGYQWYFNGALIPGATGPVHFAEASGEYSLEITDANGCTARSNPFIVLVSGLEHMFYPEGLSVFPNPFQDYVRILGNQIENAVLIDVTGRMVKEQRFDTSSKIELHLPGLPSGVYYLKTKTARGEYLHKVCKY